MRGAILHAPRDIRVEQREDPTIEQPTDAVIRLAATCVCGSDLWPFRGIEDVWGPAPMGHEYVGFVRGAGRNARTPFPGRSAVASSFAPATTSKTCRPGSRPPAVTAELWG